MVAIDGAEVAKHNNAKSCWIVINSKVYDVTSFLDQHPGGATILLKNAGADATAEFNKYHSPDYVEDLPKGSYLGLIDLNTLSSLNVPKSSSSKPSAAESKSTPRLSLCVSANDFEAAAQAVLPRKSWIYASSSANSGLALKSNLEDWSKIQFRPRIMRNVESIDMGTTILGQPSAYPFYVSPMGTLGVIHPEGEPELVKGIVNKGLHGVISTASSKPTDRIMESFVDEQKRLNNKSPSRLFFQLYIHTDRNKAIELLRKVKKLGYKGLWITVDAPVIGKRTADRREQAQEALDVGLSETESKPYAEGDENNTFAPALGGRPVPGQLDARTTWDYLKWIRQEWDGPIVIKGIQCVEDAKLAMDHGCQGILLSNHGGRQLHSAPSALMTLLEIRTYCPEVFSKLEVFVDGGLRDGSDVLKALCLGATAVGVGRPFLYSLGAFGAAGVEKCIDILSEEVAMAMRLLGITSLDQVRPEMVNASRLLNEMWRPERPTILSRL